MAYLAGDAEATSRSLAVSRSAGQRSDRLARLRAEYAEAQSRNATALKANAETGEAKTRTRQAGNLLSHLQLCRSRDLKGLVRSAGALAQRHHRILQDCRAFGFGLP